MRDRSRSGHAIGAASASADAVDDGEDEVDVLIEDDASSWASNDAGDVVPSTPIAAPSTPPSCRGPSPLTPPSPSRRTRTASEEVVLQHGVVDAGRTTLGQFGERAPPVQAPMVYDGPVPIQLEALWTARRSDGGRGGGWAMRATTLAGLVLRNDPLLSPFAQLVQSRASQLPADRQGQWIQRCRIIADLVLRRETEAAHAMATMLQHEVDTRQGR